MMRMLLLLSIVSMVLAENAAQWAHQVVADKTQIGSGIKSLAESAKVLTLLEQDSSKVEGFAETAHQAAADKYQARIQDAKAAYQTAQSDLHALPAGANTTDAENEVKKSAHKLQELEEDQKTYARKTLHDMRQKRIDSVLKTLNETKGDVEKMKKDRNYLEDARRHEGWSEQRFEREEMDNERWAENSQLSAERQKDNSTEAIDRIFGRAESHLEGLLTTASTDQKAGAELQSAFQDLVALSPGSFLPVIGLCLAGVASSLGLVRFMGIGKRPVTLSGVEPLLG